ncbi:MAG: SDR family NAD(P)-dependent oxidoreductase [Myxococcota bacterium]
MNALTEAFRLDGRVAAITGAASGIGAACAEVLAAAGAHVLLGDVDEAGAEAVAGRIRASGGAAVVQRCDVQRRAEVDAFVDRAAQELGRLDVLCNVAGVPSDGPLADVTDAELDRVLGINLKGVLYGCQAALRVMAARGGGSIVNVSSAVIDAPAAGYGVYAITKAAVASLTQTFALEAGPSGVRVNAIAPGATLTAFTERHLRGPDGKTDPARLEAFLDAMRQRSPLGRVGEALDQAWLVLYLASDASRFATGQIWRANGGQAFGR